MDPVGITELVDAGIITSGRNINIKIKRLLRGNADGRSEDVVVVRAVVIDIRVRVEACFVLLLVLVQTLDTTGTAEVERGPRHAEFILVIRRAALSVSSSMPNAASGDAGILISTFAIFGNIVTVPASGIYVLLLQVAFEVVLVLSNIIG